LDRQLQAYGLALLTVLCWATSASAFKLSLGYLAPDELLFYASLASFLVLSITLFASAKHHTLAHWHGYDYGRSALLGLLNPFGYYLILFQAYNLLPAQEAQPLNFVWPIVLVLLSAIILRQPLKLGAMLAMLVSFSGVVVIATRGDVLSLRFTNSLGVSLALASTVIWALYWLYGVKDERDPLARLCLNFSFGFVYILLYQLLFANWRIPPLAGLAGATYIGLFEMGFAFVLWLQALKRSRSTAQIGNLIYLTPFCSLLVIHWVVGEPIYPSTLTGLVLIISGILLQQYLSRRNTKR